MFVFKKNQLIFLGIYLLIDFVLLFLTNILQGGGFDILAKVSIVYNFTLPAVIGLEAYWGKLNKILVFAVVVIGYLLLLIHYMQ
ncbi:hypothetical protein SAMN05216249_1235 [Acetitomaculum ruminis DSM 5522]|uniref:Uncharacterized protein n=1 Tax=Acetitomaculum ruminis DSM 5522 TaxID=1120918 RepID=A0A1I1A8V7_9FIRM|nr:hypothetical protein [Acetitomaculum ruminis]SFB34429.1 hypothetical protein SAMN05216249_1235 [Acetitomaculum ruminis DSM 5522]